MKTYLTTRFGGGLAIALYMMPFVAFAAGEGEEKLLYVLRLFNLVIPIIFVIALIYFLWGLTQLMLDIDKKTNEAKDKMIWGVIVMVVMVSIWAIVALVRSTFGIDNNTQPNDYPTFQAK